MSFTVAVKVAVFIIILGGSLFYFMVLNLDIFYVYSILLKSHLPFVLKM